MTLDYYWERESIANVMKWMYTRGIVQVRGGNASIVLPGRREMLISPTGIPRPLIGPGMIAKMTLNGEILEGKPSSEWKMHAAIYKAQPEAKAIVHAHPKSLLLVTSLGLYLDPKLMSEAGLQVTCLGRVPYIRPGTLELADAVAREAGRGCNVIIMERHGAAVWSDRSIYHALDLLEAIEDLAWITYHSELQRRVALC